MQIKGVLQEYLELKEAIAPFDLLGRSLAYNPYVPRLAPEHLKRPDSQEVAHRILYLDASMDLENLLGRLERVENIQALLLDFKAFYAEGMPPLEMLDLLGYVRRLSPKPLIQRDMFISHYQLLDALVHGADAVILDASFLQEDLKAMLEYATHLGLLPIVEVSSKKDLKTSILAKAQVLYFTQDFKNLLKLTPQRQIILRDLGTLALDAQNSYGVDGFIITT